MLALGFASFCNDLVTPTSWGTCMDVGGKLAGTLSGTMNMMGNFGGALYPVATGYILREFATIGICRCTFRRRSTSAAFSLAGPGPGYADRED